MISEVSEPFQFAGHEWIFFSAHHYMAILQSVWEICATLTLLFSVFSSCWWDSSSQNDTVWLNKYFGLKMCLAMCDKTHF